MECSAIGTTDPLPLRERVASAKREPGEGSLTLMSVATPHQPSLGCRPRLGTLSRKVRGEERLPLCTA